MKKTEWNEAMNQIDSDILESFVLKQENLIRNNRRKAVGMKVSMVAACFMMVLGMFGVHFALNGNNTVKAPASATIMLDVNPSINIEVDENRNIIQVVPLNGDAESVIENIDFTGINLEHALDAIIDSMIAKGYIDEIQNAVLLSVYSTDTDTANDIKNQTAEMVAKKLEDKGVVISKTTTEEPASISTLAKKYSITTGKCEFINAILPLYPKLTFKDLANASISDLCLLFYGHENTDNGYKVEGNAKNIISHLEAITIAMNHFELAPGKVTSIINYVEFRRNKPIYVVALTSSLKDEYRGCVATVDLLTGECTEFVNDFSNGSPYYNEINEGGIDCLTAIEIAFENLSIDTDENTGIVIMHYEEPTSKDDYWSFAFDCAETYEIDIDAMTGKVITINKSSNN